MYRGDPARSALGPRLVGRGHERLARAAPLARAASAAIAATGSRRINAFADGDRAIGPAGAEGRWSLRSSRWPESPTATERAAAIARSLLERYGVVLREAAGAENLPGGFGYVYDVYRAMEEQGRLRRGYFVAGRGATQFALPGAEERLRAPKRADSDEEPTLLAATDPANPWGSLLPWPASPARSPQRSPGARVLLQDGRLLAWMSRGGKRIATFFAEDEPARTQDARQLARALTALNRTVMLESIDGVPATASPVAHVLTQNGFSRRQGTLVRIPPSDPSFGRRRLGAHPAPVPEPVDVGIDLRLRRGRSGRRRRRRRRRVRHRLRSRFGRRCLKATRSGTSPRGCKSSSAARSSHSPHAKWPADTAKTLIGHTITAGRGAREESPHSLR